VWEGEYNFAYLDKSYQFYDNLDIDAHAASKDIKRKFCFPSHDPSENLIVDDRPDSTKVADILRMRLRLRPKSGVTSLNVTSQKILHYALDLELLNL
jgi:hypothetical protein